MTAPEAYRRFYAEEIETAATLTSRALVDALAAVPRDRFLPAGPWTIRAEGDFLSGSRHTADADPRRVHHNVAVAIDAGRTLFNGAPGVVAMALDRLALAPGQRLLHVGTGLGYYTALAAECVGPGGRVTGIEVDPDLAAGARDRLAAWPWVEVRHGDATDLGGESFDAILINAGVTHPLPLWLDALRPAGRMVLPLTATAPGMATIGKGPMLCLARDRADAGLSARILGFVAIYSALGVRDEARNHRLAQTLARQPFAPVTCARRDAHDETAACWFHVDGFCLSLH